MNQKAQITWFRQDHEHRNDWLRMGFMRLHRAGDITYTERPYAARSAYGFDPNIPSEKAVSLLAIEQNGIRRRCIVESNDSFFVMSPQVANCDLYFCAGYNNQFFKEKTVPAPLAWQTPEDVVGYQALGQRLIEELGEHFEKVRPFIPIAPNMGRPSPVPWGQQKLRNLRHRVESRLRDDLPWNTALEDFELRYAALLALRNRPVERDIALLDTLWGWPKHRHTLHLRLAERAAEGYRIQSKLNWSPPSELDGSALNPLPKNNFPLQTGAPISNYEALLASSRLAVFATGFHYGWRNIMTLALMIGIPVLADRLLLEPYFDMGEFDILWNDDGDWSSLVEALRNVTEETRRGIATSNLAIFDRYMAPEACSRFIISTAQNKI